ncbi:hypothetical protein P8452_42656 [Trifolium repens]|nr:hypothetical protein P8452_42656 [Trifolium repens]
MKVSVVILPRMLVTNNEKGVSDFHSISLGKSTGDVSDKVKHHVGDGVVLGENNRVEKDLSEVGVGIVGELPGIRRLKTKFRNQNPKSQLPELALASWWRVKAESSGLTRPGARPGELS